MRSYRRIGRYLLAFVGIPLALFLVLELATRLFGPDDLFYQTYDPVVLDLRDGKFLFVNRAGYQGVIREAYVEINSQHIVGPELKDDGRPRLLLLGDSVLFASGIELGEAPDAVLERLLDGKFAVMNAGCIGYSSEHELAYLQEFGDRLAPNMVVLGYCLNDPMSPKAMNLVGVATAKSKKWAGWLVTANLVLRKHSKFFVWLKGVMGLEKRQNGYHSSIEPLFDDKSWNRNRGVLLEINQWCKSRGIPVMLVVFPHREQLQLGESSYMPQRRLLELRGEFPIVDLTGSLEVEDFLFGDPLHLDRNGIYKSMVVIANAVRTINVPADSLGASNE